MKILYLVKGKTMLRHVVNGGSGSTAPPFLTLVLDGGEWLASCPGFFKPRERSLSVPIGSVGPRALLLKFVA
jgi:hypothetical protein